MRLKTIVFSVVILFGFIALTACLKDKAVAPSAFTYTCDDSVSYSNDIAALIIDPSCNFSGCHNSGTSAAGYSFSNYAEVSANSAIILEVLAHQEGVVPMPLGGAILADSLIKKFYCWIEQGKLDN